MTQEEEEDKMVVVGPRVADFVTEISIIVQKHVHFNINKWKHVPEVAKEKIVTKVLDSFDVDGAHPENTKDVILFIEMSTINQSKLLIIDVEGIHFKLLALKR
ncbi:hypothetical protein glysoja_024413 [Glycine soja]|uniref:Uncharacterized protein n=1 Tax=Glycine soja TaxID=3848 RepID=A0A0B2SKP1_GLYSO|nr:hypothetical protein JHK86_001589 [Glycine max]KHN44842.1 hypothetical protein glysoja_024413 [Glycine soja]